MNVKLQRRAYLVNPCALPAERVLVDSDQVLVEEDFRCFWVNISQVDRHDKRRREYRPQGHLCSPLIKSRPKISDYKL